MSPTARLPAAMFDCQHLVKQIEQVQGWKNLLSTPHLWLWLMSIYYSYNYRISGLLNVFLSFHQADTWTGLQRSLTSYKLSLYDATLLSQCEDIFGEPGQIFRSWRSQTSESGWFDYLSLGLRRWLYIQTLHAEGPQALHIIFPFWPRKSMKFFSISVNDRILFRRVPGLNISPRMKK